MEDPASGLVIAFNGEIYNYKELAEELSKAGCKFRSHSDTEVLLKSYEMWGTECLGRLNGMFAFAIWDERRQQLFAARDRFGEKPFYYHQDDGRRLFIFGSEIKALIASGVFEPRANQPAIYAFLVNREIDASSETVFEGVQSLAAAHALRYSVKDATVKVWRYWELNPENEIRLFGDQQYADALLEILTDSVRIRLRSDVPVGSSLSGGLDSSTIVGLIARCGAKEGQATFSARFADSRFDEGAHIENMAHSAKATSHFVYPAPERIPEEMEALTWHQEEPFYSTSIYAQWCVMRLAKQCGVTVLLDGQGGDEVLAGYHEYFRAYYLQLLKHFHIGDALSSMGLYAKDHGRELSTFVFSGLVPDRLRAGAKRWLRPRAVRREFEQKWKRPPVRVKRKFENDLDQSLYVTLTQTVLPQLLRYADRNSMAYSREVRLPFLDHRLVEFLYAIPMEQKLRGSTTKIILRNAIKSIVPEEIRNRKDKLGFAAPEVSWLRGPLRKWTEEIFSSSEFREREWLDPTMVDNVWKRFQAGEGSLYTSVWRLLSLELWARTFLASKSMPRNVRESYAIVANS